MTPEAVRRVRAWWFAQLLGLDALAPRVRVSAVTVVGERLRVEIETPDGSLAIVLEPRSEREAFLKTRHHNVSYVGKALPDPVHRALRGLASRRLERYPFERLVALATRGDGPTAAAVAGPPADQVVPVAASSEESPREAGPEARPSPSPPVYFDFFGYDSFESLGRPTGALPRLFQLVLHCDNECSQHGPESFGGAAAALDTPYREGAERGVDLSPSPQVSGLTERDVILGNAAGLRQAVSSAAALTEVEPRPLLLCNTCVPSVTGEDVEGIANEAAEGPTKRVHVMGPGPEAVVRLLRRVLTKRFGPGSAQGPAGPARRVSLVGVPDDAEAAELRALLSELGLEVTSVVVPDLDWGRLDALRDAGTHVYVAHRWWQPLFAALQAVVPGRHVVLPAPYGPAGTRAWLSAVAEAVGVDVDPVQVADRAWGARRADWEAATTRVRGHTVAFVVDVKTVACLADPAEAWGVPLVDVCCEAGFDVEIWRHADVPAAGLDPLLARLAGSPTAGRVDIRDFADQADLDRSLAASSARAVLSQYRLDRRLTVAGKNRIALAGFEMGFDGAVRTVRRLDGLCERAFFPLFGRYVRGEAP